MSRLTALRFGVAVALTLALDLGLSLLRGYVLRDETPLLLLVQGAALAAIAVPCLAILDAVGRRRAAPVDSGGSRWTPVLVSAGLAPVAAGVVAAAGRPADARRELAAAAAIAVVAFAESRGLLPSFRPRGAVAVLAIAAATVWASTALPLHGRGMLRDPRPGPAQIATAERPNVLLVVLDTVRADHLGVYGYPRPTTPFLDRFAREATVFERAVADSNWTLPSHASIFTSLYAEAHGADMVPDTDGTAIDVSKISRVRDQARVQPLSDDATTIAELAREAGLETGAICGNVTYLYSIFGLGQGFDTYVDARGNPPRGVPVGLRIADAAGVWRFWPYRRAVYRNNQSDRTAGEVNRLALEWLEPRRDRRFFLFLNYMDAHDPYLPTWRLARRFPAAAGPGELDREAVVSGRRPILDDERAPKVDAYDAEIRGVDEHLEDLFSRLRAWGLLDRTLVVVVGDHGESFGEHYDLGHGNNVYDTEIRVPLLVRRPGQRTGDRIARPVHHVDVAPTLLDALAIPIPASTQGVSLFEPRRRLPVVSYSGNKPALGKTVPRYLRGHSALVRGDWKLITHTDGTSELYDLARDPHEAEDLAARRPEIVEALAEELAAFRRVVRPAFGARPATLDEEAVRRLKSLGYLP